MTKDPIRPPQDELPLRLCHWLYHSGLDCYRVDIMALFRVTPTSAGGVDIDFQYEVRAAFLIKEIGAFEYRFEHRLFDQAAVQGQVAAGTDPLYISHVKRLPIAAQLARQFPQLAALYDGISLNTAPPTEMQAVNSPHL